MKDDTCTTEVCPEEVIRKMLNVPRTCSVISEKSPDTSFPGLKFYISLLQMSIGVLGVPECPKPMISATKEYEPGTVYGLTHITSQSP